ncbi:hypothetical protein [Streptomyces prunicolor]|uniref:hypothetical protein n=1 Tax=Streptomyces prunicolor TaxID=67348 RepID=UPI0003777E39|nr:hypothetical protein [Streptomyces prunicolor]
MSSAPLQLLIYSIADTERAAALTAITDADLRLEYGRTPPPSLELGELYGADFASVGKSTILADALRREAPSATFELWQDPDASVGHYIAHVPGIGSFDSGCDQDGTPLVDALDMARHLTALPPGTTVAAWLTTGGNELLGRAVLDALDACRSTLADDHATDRDTTIADGRTPPKPLPTTVGAFHLLDGDALEECAREHYGRAYSAVAGLEGDNDSAHEATASLTHTALDDNDQPVQRPGLAANDRADLDLWLAGDGGDPHPGVILSDLAQHGLAPTGPYLVRLSW